MMNHLLPQTCVIQRYTKTGVALNNDPVYSWATLATPKCRLYRQSGKEFDQPHQAVVTTPKVMMMVTDVTEKDRLVIGGETYEVLVVNTIYGMSSAHHLELEVMLVKE